VSTTNTVTIWCDHGTGRPCIEWFAGLPGRVLAARTEARAAGWRYLPGHTTTGPGRDLCPKHTKEGNPRG